MKPLLPFPTPVTPEFDSGKLPSRIRVFSDLVYAAGTPDQSLDLYLPDRASEPVPLVVYFHEGAFAFGSKRDRPLEYVLPLLDRGFALAAVDYRKSDVSTWPGLIYDAKAAIRFLRSRAVEFRLDADRFAAWGISAGGYIASMLGVTGKISAFEDPAMGNEGVSSEVQLVIDWYGCCGGFQYLDQQVIENRNGNANHHHANSPESIMLGSALSDIPELCRLASPYAFVHRDMPPFLIQHGKADAIVPVQQSLTFAAAIERVAGKEKVKLLLYNKGHQGNSLTDDPQPYQDAFEFLDKAFMRPYKFISPEVLDGN